MATVTFNCYSFFNPLESQDKTRSNTASGFRPDHDQGGDTISKMDLTRLTPMLASKTALVVGASRGIGAGIARELAACGAHVILAARTSIAENAPSFGSLGPILPGSLKETLVAIRESGGSAESHSVDLLQPKQVETMIKKIRQHHEHLDVVVNCAMGFPDSYEGSISDSDDDQWQSMIDVGVRGKYLINHHVSKIMKRQKDGLIVNISAGASKIDYYSPIFRIAMAAVDRMTEAVAHDLRDDGVSCISLWPRWVRTEWMLMAAKNPALGIQVSKNDLATSDSPEFIGRAIAHLAADPNVKSYSGHIIPVVALSHRYGFSDIDDSQPPLDDFTKTWITKLNSIRKTVKS